MQTVSFDSLSGTSRLFLDFIGCSDTAIKYYKYDFKSMSSYLDAAEWIDRTAYDREKLASIIDRAASTLNLPEKVRSNIGKLADPRSLVVFSGQQVGIYLGPMYTVIKALTTYKLALKLESVLNRPVVPCFWMATDDHDFDEIKAVNLLDRSGNCHQLLYEPSVMDGDAPMSDLTLDGAIEKFHSSFSDKLLATEFTPALMEILKNRYKSGTGVSRAFAGLFADFLGEFGIIPVDPNYPGMKKLFSDVFRQEIENHKTIFDLYESASQELLDAGYHRQVHKSGESLNLFFNKGGRRNIMHANDSFHLDGTDVSIGKSALLEMLDSEPEKFSPDHLINRISQHPG